MIIPFKPFLPCLAGIGAVMLNDVHLSAERSDRVPRFGKRAGHSYIITSFPAFLSLSCLNLIGKIS